MNPLVAASSWRTSRQPSAAPLRHHSSDNQTAADPFAGLVARCVRHNCGKDDEAVRKTIDEQIGGRYSQFLTDVASRLVTPGGNIVVVGYPHLVEEPDRWKGVAQATDVCNGIGRGEADRLRGWAGLLNAEIGSATEQANRHRPNDVTFTFVNIADGAGPDSTGQSRSNPDLYEPAGSEIRHNLCGTKPWLNGLHPTKGFHPNLTGHFHTGRLVAGVVDGLDWSRLEVPAAPVTRTVWGSGVNTREGPSTAFALGPHQFEAGATITIVCQAEGGRVTSESTDYETVVWDLLDTGYWVTDLWIDNQVADIQRADGVGVRGFSSQIARCDPSAIPTLPSNIDCGYITFTPQTEDGATDIRATGIGCEEARALVEAVRRDSSYSARSRSFSMRGFQCTALLRDPNANILIVEYTCTRGDAQVRWEH